MDDETAGLGIAPLQQKDVHQAAVRDLVGDPQRRWIDLVKKRLRTTFSIGAASIDTVDFGSAFSFCYSVKGHVAMCWIKTVSNGWCTSRRFHEQLRLPCIFGCDNSCDDLAYYLTCPPFNAVCSQALLRVQLGAVSIDDHPTVSAKCLAALGLMPVSRDAFFHTYMLFSVYHSMKCEFDSGVWDSVLGRKHTVHDRNGVFSHFLVERVRISDPLRRRAESRACAFAVKLAALVRRRRSVPPRGAPTVFLRGYDPWIGVAHPR